MLREKLVKIGAKGCPTWPVRHVPIGRGRRAERTVPENPEPFDDLRRRPAPAQAGKIDGRVKTTGGVCLNGGKYGQMALQATAGYENQAIGRLRKRCSSLGGETVVRFSRIRMSIWGMSIKLPFEIGARFDTDRLVDAHPRLCYRLGCLGGTIWEIPAYYEKVRLDPTRS